MLEQHPYYFCRAWNVRSLTYYCDAIRKSIERGRKRAVYRREKARGSLFSSSSLWYNRGVLIFICFFFYLFLISQHSHFLWEGIKNRCVCLCVCVCVHAFVCLFIELNRKWEKSEWEHPGDGGVESFRPLPNRIYLFLECRYGRWQERKFSTFSFLLFTDLFKINFGFVRK